MSFIRPPFLRYALFLNLAFLDLAFLGGCSQSVFIKAPVNLYHDLEGGIVSQPRLPVPGNDQKYPHVGLTPTAAPPLPSPELRRTITDSLSHDRNLSEWEDVKDPLTIPTVPPLPNASPASPTQSAGKQPANNTPNATSGNKPATNNQSSSDQASSASFDAAGEPPPPPANTAQNTGTNPNGNQGKSNASTAAKPAAKPTTKPAAPEPVVMPALRTVVDNETVTLPEIPVAPPAPSRFPNFNIPADVNLPAPSHPSGLPLENPTGELIRFPVDSDTPYAHQEGTINNLAWHRNGGILFVHGYGDTTSMDPDAQTKALALALLRAKTVAKMLISHNVPESAIVIRAHAFGHGVRVRTDD